MVKKDKEAGNYYGFDPSGLERAATVTVIYILSPTFRRPNTWTQVITRRRHLILH